MTPLRLPRPLWLEIDLDAAAANLAAARALVGSGRKLFAVVKGDGYGYGSLEMAQVFGAGGADALALADLGDALRLRRHGVRLPILMYPNALPELAAEALAADVMPTIADEDAARAYAAAATGPFPAFIKVDVGLERLGVPAERAVAFVRGVVKLRHLALEGIYSHLHLPPGADGAYVGWQLARFVRVVEELDAEGVRIPVRMIASSLAVLRFPETHLNAVDPGRMLYGVGQLAAGLRPVFAALKTRLIAAKDTTRRSRFADRAPFALDGVRRVGVIPAGWGDGLGTLATGHVLVSGVAVRVLGAPSFEHTRVDLTAVPHARVGDEVVVIGRQGDAEITLAEVAALRDVDPVQLAPAARERVARVYVSSGRVVKVRTA